MENCFSKIRILIVIILTSFYTMAQDSIHIEKNTKSPVPEDFYLSDFSCSLINLIATPEKYNNKRVRVIGYLNLEFEGNAIYIHKQDYKKSITSNGFWVTFTDKSWSKIKKYGYNKDYFLIEGTFDMTNSGHMGLWSGAIKDITRIDKWH